MIKEYNAKMYCCEDISKIENYEAAVADQTTMWHCHHKLEMFYTMQELLDNKRYLSVPARELVFLSPKEHCQWPHKGRGDTWKNKIREATKGNKRRLGKHHSEESKRKMSEALKGHPGWNKGIPAWNKGKVDIYSDDTKAKMSEARSKANVGCHWYNDGVKNVFCKACPTGYKKGKLSKAM